MADQQLVLMQRDVATMFVPVSKVEQYKTDGWVEISRAAAPAEEAPAFAPIPEPKAEKPKAKGKP